MSMMKRASILLGTNSEEVIQEIRNSFNKKVENFILDTAKDDVIFMEHYKANDYDFVLLQTSIEWCIQVSQDIRETEKTSK